MQPELPPIDEMLAVIKKAYESGKRWEDRKASDGFTLSPSYLPDTTTVANRVQSKIEELAALRIRSYQRIICNIPSFYWESLNLLEDDRQLEILINAQNNLDKLSKTELVRFTSVITTSYRKQ